MALMVQEKNPAGKSNLRVSCDSMNCIRFDGYNLSPATIAEHPNRNEALLMSSDEKSKLFDRFSLKVTLPLRKIRKNHKLFFNFPFGTTIKSLSENRLLGLFALRAFEVS